MQSHFLFAKASRRAVFFIIACCGTLAGGCAETAVETDETARSEAALDERNWFTGWPNGNVSGTAVFEQIANVNSQFCYYEPAGARTQVRSVQCWVQGFMDDILSTRDVTVTCDGYSAKVSPTGTFSTSGGSGVNVSSVSGRLLPYRGIMIDHQRRSQACIGWDKASSTTSSFIHPRAVQLGSETVAKPSKWEAILRCDGATLNVDTNERRNLSLVVHGARPSYYVSRWAGLNGMLTFNGVNGDGARGVFGSDDIRSFDSATIGADRLRVHHQGSDIKLALETKPTSANASREKENWIFRNCH